jgi:hypothetical protein
MPGLVPGIHVFLAFLDHRLTAIGCFHTPDSSPFTRGAFASEPNVKGERRLRPWFRKPGPGRPWRCLPAHYGAQGSFLTSPVRRRRKPTARRASGAPRSDKTPQWSAVGAAGLDGDRPPCLTEHGSCWRLRRSAPSLGSEDGLRPFGGSQTKTLPNLGAKSKRESEARAGAPAARMTKLGCLTIG